MKREIKLVALDMDGTLLDDQKRLSEKNEETLRRCLEQGIHIVPTTGRTWEGVPDEIRALPGMRYAITTNGAIIMDAKQDQAIRERKLTNELAMEIMDLAETFQVMYDPYVDGRGYTQPRFFEHMEEYGVSELIQELVRRTRTLVPDIREFVRASGKPVEKVNYFFADMEERARVKALLEQRDDIVVTSSIPNNLEINAPGATKGDALWALADHLGIDRSQTMACGDGENDFTLIKQAGIGVAMANGYEELKAVADFVTLSNSEDGVAAAIERFVL